MASTRLVPPSGRVASTILIVDDDQGVVESFARMLQLEGFTVHTATTADTGLRQVDAVQPDDHFGSAHAADGRARFSASASAAGVPA